MQSAFEMFTGSGQNAKIRSNFYEKQHACRIDGQHWDPIWDNMFVDEFDDKIHDKYNLLVKSFLNDIVTPDIK